VQTKTSAYQNVALAVYAIKLAFLGLSMLVQATLKQN